MARMKFVQYRKAMSIVLLLLAAVPGMAAEGNILAALQLAQDSLFEQLQRQTREAEARAAEAEKRERDAEINRLTDQAQQAQSHADAEAQRSLAVQRELFIQQAKTELHNSAYSRLEILIGVFGALITTLVVFFAWNTKETAIAAAKAGVEDIRGKLEARLMEAEALLEKIRKHQTDADKILKDLGPGEVPKSEADRKTIADAARVALAKPLKDRSANDYHTILTNYHAEGQWSDMLRTAQQMQLLHEGDYDSAFARYSEAYALRELQRPDEEIAAYDDVIVRFGAAPDAALRELVARVLVNKVDVLDRLGRSEEAIAVCDDVVARFGAAPEAALREGVARALVNKGVVLGQLGRSEEAIEVYDDVVARFGAAPEAALWEHVAMALFNKGFVLGQLNRSEEAIDVYDDVVARYGAATEPALREQVAKALFNKGLALRHLNRSEEAIAVNDDVIARYGAAPEAALRDYVAMALFNKGVALRHLNRSEEAIAVWDDVVARFGAVPEAALRELVARALFNTACVYARKGSGADAIKALQAMIKAGHPLDLKQIAGDNDFDSIRNDPAFRKFLDEYGG